MKKLFLLLLLASPVSADMTHNITTSTQLTVNGAYTDASRIGSTYTVSGSNIKVADDAHFGKLTAGTATAAATLDVGAVSYTHLTLPTILLV